MALFEYLLTLTLSLLTMPSPKLIKLSKITNWVNLKNKQQHHSKVLLNSFAMNGHTLASIESKVRNFVSPKVSLWESKG